MPSFSIPLSGLSADSTALNTIANNLSNLSTTAYKEQKVTFSDSLYQSLASNGAGDPLSVGSGVNVASITTNFSSTSSTSTSLDTDMAIDGDGFFVVQQGETQYLTRNGNFTLSSTGVLETQNGETVMGYPVTSSGTVDTSSALSTITIPVNTVETPTATTSGTIVANLDADGTAGAGTSTTFTVYDSLGVAHTATVTFTKDSTNNEWDYNVTMDASNFTAGATGTVQLATGTMQFNSSGMLTTVSDTTNGDSASGSLNPSISITTPVTYADGGGTSTFNWNLFDSSTGTGEITQVASSSGSSITSHTTNGNTTSKYSSFTVDSDGTVEAVYENGDKKVLGQVAIASVTNEEGLQAMGNNLYSTTNASGEASIGIAGSGGRGDILDGYLENSNVDVSTEFANLIVAQRAFEANAKAVTTFDTVTEDTINLIR